MPVAENEGKDALSATHKAKNSTSSSKVAPASKDQTSSSDSARSSQSEKNWVYICNPEEETCGDEHTCVCGKAADENTTHQPWVVTQKGFELAAAWRIQKGKRDQDAFEMYIFNHWTGYGICEVMENMFLAFNRETGKLEKDPFKMWSYIEGMALFISGDIMEWHMLKDPEGHAKRTMLIGTALITTLEALGARTEYTHLEDIENAGLILAHLLTFAQIMNKSCTLNENGWKSKVLRTADELNIIIGGVPAIEEVLAEIRETGEGGESEEDSDEDSDGESDEDSDEDSDGESDEDSDKDSDRESDEDSDEGSDEDLDEDSDDDLDQRWTIESESGVDREDLEKCFLCYQSEPWAAVFTTKKPNIATNRTWRYSNWRVEFLAYSEFQALKVGPRRGPMYGGNIGGKFYDLTTQQNKGGHMKQYRLSEEAW